jgi:hypothetical protein
VPILRSCANLLLTLVILLTGPVRADDPDGDAGPQAPTRDAWYTFSWPVGDHPNQIPRGGTTTGPAITPADTPSKAWLALRDAALPPKERDRRAILAMTGEYRTTFDFLETMTFVPNLPRARPYQSWATEYVFVVDEGEDFISLQHIMVMSFVEDARVRGPAVQKHWRQDWRYQADHALVFRGEHLWEVSAIVPRVGTWTQTVYEVDDTPRYAATGAWSHHANLSLWESDRTWRPLPRREHTVRDDYGALASEHRISITPGGWGHEQDNLKVVIAEAGSVDAQTPYLAREQGLARYIRISGFDFDPGREYWSSTADYWQQVRQWWHERLAREGGFRLQPEVDGKPLFVSLFEGAARAAEDPDFDEQARRDYVRSTLSRYVDAP